MRSTSAASAQTSRSTLIGICRYSFNVLPDHNMLNAFSLPGGPVYIGEGMLGLMTNEDELASALAQ